MVRASTIAVGLVAVLLAAASALSPGLAVLSVLASILAALLLALGPERLGTGLVLIGMVLAPMNDLRPVGGSITVSDLCMALGFLLLMPRLMERHSRVPLLFALGCVGLLVTSVASSLVAPESARSLALAVRLILATSVIPLLFLLWRPDRPLLRRLAWAYVVGQIINTVYAVSQPGRVDGLTVHPNAFAIDGLIASALLIYLWHETARNRRWIVLAAGAISVYSILLSGSRGALLALILVAVLYPIVERSAASSLTAALGALIAFPSLLLLADRAGDTSALGRLLGRGSDVAGSDSARREELTTALERFFDSPVLGNGFNDELLFPHNIFLQVAVAIGVIGLASYLLLLTSFVSVLFSNLPDRRLGYVTMAYLGVGMTQPSLWDRNIWAALCLTLVAAAATAQDDEPDATGDAETTTAPRTGVRRAAEGR